MGDYLQQVEEQLAELTERGAHRRPRPRLDLIAAGAAIAVVVAVVAVVSTIGQNAHRSSAVSHNPHSAVHHQLVPPHHARPRVATVTVPSAELPGGPVPAGFGPESFTATGELTWWLLGDAPCSSPPCTSIVRTTDGGRSFVGIPAPRTQNVSQLRFANALNGFAYGPGLWVTHDGGEQWNEFQISKGAQVTQLAIGGGYAYAIFRSANGGGNLVRAAIGSDAWKTLPMAGDAYSGLWVHGSNVMLETQSSSSQNLMLSSDHGEHFTATAVPPSVACQFEMPAPPVVWAHCATGMMSGTWRSVAGGRSFVAAGRSAPELPNSAAFGSASATTAVVGYRQLYRTTDGGASWSPVSGPSGITWWQYLGFTDPTHGVAIGYVGSSPQPGNERLYYTTDAGASYHSVSIR